MASWARHFRVRSQLLLHELAFHASFTVPTPSSESYNRHPMSASDPTPLELAQPDAPRGRLKVFLGYASGVGKSFRMFDEARRRKERGQDVVVGALQPQNPPEIESILSSLEIVPTIDIEGVPVIDVPAILRRHPRFAWLMGWLTTTPGVATHTAGRMSRSCWHTESTSLGQ